MDKTLSLIDITDPAFIDVQIDKTGKKLWVNIDGVCRLRAQFGPKVKLSAHIIVNDERNNKD